MHHPTKGRLLEGNLLSGYVNCLNQMLKTTHQLIIIHVTIKIHMVSLVMFLTVSDSCCQFIVIIIEMSSY